VYEEYEVYEVYEVYEEYENLLTRVNHTDYQSGGHVTISRKKKIP
jgi:hypothetical protein